MNGTGFSGKKGISLALILCLMLAASGCGGGDAAAAAGGMSAGMSEVTAEADQGIAVEVYSPTTGSLDRQTEFVGRIEAAETVRVYPETSGKVLRTYFNEGDTVTEGDLLFEIDDTDLQTSVDLAYLQYQSAINSAESALASAEQNLKTAARSYYTAQDNTEDAEDQYDDQLSDLRSARNAARTKMRNAEAAVNTAQAEVDAYLASNPGASEDTDATYKGLMDTLRSAQSEYSSAQSAYNQADEAYDAAYDEEDRTSATYRTTEKNAEITLEYAQKNYDLVAGDESGEGGSYSNMIAQAKLSYDNAVDALEDAKVYAPVSGVITTKNVNENENASTAAESYVISVTDQAPVVTFNLSEDGANALSIGSQVTVIYDGREIPATIIEMSNDADSATGLYEAKAQPSEDLGTTRTGAAVKVQASTARADNATLLPIDYVDYDEDQPYVYVYQDGVAVRRDLTLGMQTAEYVVVESGLEAGDEIITTWHPDLADGAKVYLKSSADAGAGSSEPAGESDTLPAAGQSDSQTEAEGEAE